MRVSDQFQQFLRLSVGLILLVAVTVFITLCISPPIQVHAQNAGTVGIQTVEVSVFSAQATSAKSGILPDYGFAANNLFYCDTAFAGTISLEWEPQGTQAFLTLAQASYPPANPDTGCHTLQVGGYFPNLRGSVALTLGSVSAYYTASSAPISFVSSGLGTNGASSPIVCDHNTATQIATGGESTIGNVGPSNPGDTVVICGMSIGFNGATTAGTVGVVWDSSTGCVPVVTIIISAGISWETFTTASTPQYIVAPMSQRSPNGPGSPFQFPCLINQSGATAYVTISYASVRL